jgi:hypothetical protein
MAAGLGFKDFVTGEVLTAADVDGYLMQGVWVFASAAARDAAVTSPQEGNFAYLKDTNVTTYYTGSAWANLDTTGMTNPMTTTGDIIYSSPGSTPVRLGIGTAGQVLTVASGVPSWATPGGGGGGAYVYVGGTTFSGSSAVNINDVFSSTYANYIAYVNYTASIDTAAIYRLRVSSADNTTSNYNTESIFAYSTTVGAARTANSSSFPLPNCTEAGTAHIIEFMNPFASAKTLTFGRHLVFANSSIETNVSTSAFDATTSFTGFSLLPNNGNITGTVRVYGLANA